MTAQDIARSLGGKPIAGGFIARCPAHDDRNPSLSINDSNGSVLVCCHAGCPQTDVITALKDRGLWSLTQPGGSVLPTKTITTTYDYTDKNGSLLYQVVRYEPKDFRQRRPDGRGGWVWNLRGTDRVLYRLREVVEAPIVFLVEGERDVETLRDWGFVATTAAGGTGAKWLPEFTQTLADKEVIVVPDSDQPGWKRAEVVSRALFGQVAKLKVLGLPDGIKDVTEFFEQGHSECELIATLEACNV